MTAPSRRRARPSKGRRRRRLIPLVVLILALVAVALWLTATRAVVPGISAIIYPMHFQESIARVAERHDLDPYLVAAVARAESGWDPEAVSPVGAVGLMQLMPATAQWISGLDSWQGGEEPNLTDPEDSLELGTFYLAYLRGYFGGDTRVALAAYNAGQGNVSRWLREAGGGGPLALEDIPIDETRDFVERVEYYRDLYTRVHPDAFASETGTS